MAGSNHHHIWQMLQRGFGERRGRDYHVWIYSKAKQAEQTATRLFGAEKYFYGPEGSQADANITKYENENQSAIQDLRKLPHGASVDPEFASTLISHLEIRSAFLREDTAFRIQKMLNEWMRGVQSPKDLRSLLLEQLSSNPKILDDVLAKGFIPVHLREGFQDFASLAVEKMSDKEIKDSFSDGFEIFEKAIESFPGAVKDGQNKVLSSATTFPLRSSLHLKRHYTIFRPDSGNFILPDTTLAFIKKEGAAPFIDKNDIVSAVIIPISANVAIIGKSDPADFYSLKAANKVLAGCSFKSFIANCKSDHFQSLTNRIGKYARLLSDKEIKRIANASAPLSSR